MSVLDKLTEGLVNRDLRKEGDAVVSKWDKTGLLEGLNGNTRHSMQPSHSQLFAVFSVDLLLTILLVFSP